MEHQTVIRSQARPGTGKPEGAVTSAFDMGAKAKPPRPSASLNVAELQIEHNIPLPQARTGSASPWPAVWARMKKGDMVRLNTRQATSFVSWGKKHKAALARRTLGPDRAGVWRAE